MQDMSVQILSDITTHMKYAKYLPDLKRRETWDEIVTRNRLMHVKKFPQLEEEINKAYQYVYDKKVLPSMRSLQFSGKPIEVSPSRIYNCAYAAMSDIRAFSEIMFLLLGGTGVGFSVQRHHIEQLPPIKKPNSKRETRFLIGDSIEGWSDAVRALMKSYFNGGQSIRFDYSDIRAKGARLVTSGGKAPGPEPLRICLEKIRSILNQKEEDSQLTSIEVHDIVCHIADAVLAGGIRRAALISLFSADDDEMLSAKFGTWYELNPQRGRANNSAVLLRHKVTREFFDELWKKIQESGSGEPGIFFTRDKDLGTNPCFSADTQIAVADGRGTVSIKELADNGGDVPVYSVDRITGKVEIKMGRSPRKTRENVQLVRVTLDDDTTLDVTPDHGMLLRDGTRVEAQHLKTGDSLCRFTKRLEHVSAENPNLYWRVNTNTLDSHSDRIFEHRLISKFYNPDAWNAMYSDGISNGWIRGGLVVHHKDYNPQNNAPDNLELMTFKEHAALHAAADTSGEKNGKYSGKTNSDIEQYAIQLTKSYGRRISTDEWSEHASRDGYPLSFSKWRKTNWFSSVYDLLQWAAAELGIEHISVDPRVVRTFSIAKSNGYDAFIENGRVYVTKTCENHACGCSITLPWNRRHVVYCSSQCVVRSEESILEAKCKSISALNAIQSVTRHNQVLAFNELKNELGRIPLKTEWMRRCKERNVSYRIRTEKKDNPSPFIFTSYKQLQSVADGYNHTVKSVEFIDGLHDVYNITVDDTHTVAVVTSNTDSRMSGIFVTQCCEISLKDGGLCNLCEVNVSDIESQEDFEDRVRAATFIGTLQASYTDFHYLRPLWKKTGEREALLGIGLTGIASGRILDKDLKAAAKVARTENERVADMIGIKHSARITCTKPSGTSSLVLGTSSGVHAWHSEYYIRRIRVGKNEAIYKYLAAKHPELIEDEYFRPHDTAVISVPQKAPDGAILRTESPIDLLERVKWLNKNWIKPGHRRGDNTHNVSCTISIKPEEWAEVGDWMWENRDHYNGISVLPFSDHTYKQSPFEDCTKEEYDRLMASLSSLDMTQIIEDDDNTNLANELACAGGACEIV